MGSFALIDLVSPYVLGSAGIANASVGGTAIGQPLHEVLSALFVQDVETAFDDGAVVVSGMARFSADLKAAPFTFTPPFSFSFGGTASVDHRLARHQGAVWDFPDIGIRFRLTTPRASSPVVDSLIGGPGGVPAPQTGNVQAAAVLAGLGEGVPAVGQPACDAPTTAFHLDLLIDAATLRLPGLVGAKLLPDGRLTTDPAHPVVSLTLPKIKLSFEQTAGSATADPQLSVSLDSFAAHDIDDPAGTAYAELVRMDPPYCFLGPGEVLGFGVQSVILDLSGTETPPELLAKAGVGDDFTGLYLPDVRVFVSPPGLDGLAVDASAREVLIGFGPEGGLSAIFGLDIVKPDAPQQVTTTVYDQFGAFLARIPWPDGGAFTADPIEVPPTSQWVVDVSGGQPPYNIEIGGTVQDQKPVEVTFPAGQQQTDVLVKVEDTHAGGQSRTATFPVRLTAPSLTSGSPQGGDQAATISAPTPPPPGFTVTMTDTPAAERVTLVFTPPTATATIGGNPLDVQGGRATVDLAHGAQLDVVATWPVPAVAANTPTTVTAYFAYDKPPKEMDSLPPDDPEWARFAHSAGNIRTLPSRDEGGVGTEWPDPDPVLVTDAGFRGWLAAATAADAGHDITLVGSASKEHVPLDGYNLALSQRRILALRALLTNNADDATRPVVTDTTRIKGVPEGEQPPPPHADYLQQGRAAYRSVQATVLVGAKPASTAQATVHLARPARPPRKTPTPPAVVSRPQVGSDSWRFKELHLRCEIDHDRLIAAELKLKIDIVTALESHLAKVKLAHPADTQDTGQDKSTLPFGKKRADPDDKHPDPDDGVLDVRVQLTLDDTAGRWQVLAGLFENDADGFLQSPAPVSDNEGTPTEQFWRTYAGLLIALAPLTDALASSNTPAGDAVAIATDAVVPLAALKLRIAHVPLITIYGGELTVTHDAAGTSAVLLLDVEVALIVQWPRDDGSSPPNGKPKLLDTDPKNPIKVRYKGVGFKITGRIRDLVPVFDSSKGYTIDIPSSGGIKVPAPLGDILQVAGTRIARSNPVNLELDLELKADLGMVSVDRTTIRIPLEGGHAPSISALGVHLTVPGAIEGHGYLAILDDGFAGQLDVSLPGLGIKIAAGLSIRHVTDEHDASHTATAVLVTLEVDFPVPIALGSSGLGIYGFGGLFALHFRRAENEGVAVPALDWLENVVHDGNPLDVTGWKPEIDHWAIGLGALLGTMDGGLLLNVKGMLIFEMPGPRILLVMKAKIIEAKPPRKGKPDATILAVIDVDLGRRRITIGLAFDYAVRPLLKIHVPVRAVFPFDDLTHFAIDAGSWYDAATVTFFELFTARGYFMIRGAGLPDPDYDKNHTAIPGDFPLPTALTGFSIMAGVSASYSWGSKSSGLYLSVGSAIDVGIGLAPIMFTGSLRLWGELHLWVVGIEAGAKLSVQAGQAGPPSPPQPGQPQPEPDNVALIDGEVHGSVDMFFFTISGSVHVTLGSKPYSDTKPPRLVTGVSLQSRAAALLSGVSSDRPIDGKLCDAHSDGPAPAAEAVPIDSVIVVHFDCTPLAAGANFLTANPAGAVQVPVGLPGGPPAPAVRRGDPYYIYRLKSVTLDHELTKGEVPVVWWPTQKNPTAETKQELALLTRVPDPHPSAVERSRHQVDNLTELWSTVCDRVAPAASVLWTFHDTPLGPSPVGWVLAGTAWPDPPGSTRSVPVPLRLDVAETWRSGDAAADLLVDIAPARVVGGTVPCDRGCAEHPDDGRRAVCHANVLEAPFLRSTDPDLVRAHPLGDVLATLAKGVLDQGEDVLDDVVAFKTGAIRGLQVLLGVSRILIGSGQLVMHCHSDTGALLQEFKIDGNGCSMKVSSTDKLPPLWTKPDGPWHCRVTEVVEYLEMTGKEQTDLVLVATAVDERTCFVRFGIRKTRGLIGQGLARPSYLVGVVETMTAAEGDRVDKDTATQTSKISVIDGALKAAQLPQALLLHDTEYTVSIAWEWAPCDESGTVASTAVWTAGDTQDFHFRTDKTPLAPRTVVPPHDGGTAPAPLEVPPRLDPWVLLTDPDDGEHFRFTDAPLRVVFSVDYLLQMYEAYGVAIQAKVRSASYRNSDPASANYAKTATPLTSAAALPVANGAVYTPWEDTMRGIADGLRCAAEGRRCVAATGAASRQQVLNLDLVLEPRTDYIFDIEQVGQAAPPPDRLAPPLFRRSFTTSRYRDAGAMAAAVSAGRLTETPAEASAVAALEALAGAPFSAAGLDAALRAAGLRPVTPIDVPEIEVLWVSAAGQAAQPRIIVIRSPEPLVRTRREPDKYDPPGVPRLQRSVITLVDKPYLEVVPTPGVAGAPAIQVVGEAGVNTVVLVVDTGRGAPIDLTLREHADVFLGDAPGQVDRPLLAFTLDAPTWEAV